MPAPILTHPAMLEHEPGEACPESPLRLERLLASPKLAHRRVDVDRLATFEELELVHTEAYVAHVLGFAGKVAALDYETFLGPRSVEAARRAAGIALELVDRIADGRFAQGFAAVRPPGHHAGIDAAGGYCVFNNAALAAAHARDLGLAPVLLIDWDVHHGNGTAGVFASSSDVVVVDIHQDDCFPVGSGAEDERGNGAGHGTTINVPVPPGLGDADYVHILETVLEPIARIVRPKLLLVSCGFDAHDGDPHGDQRLTEAGFAAMTAVVRRIADACAGGRVGMLLEGGYRLGVLASCVAACAAALEGDDARGGDGAGPTARHLARVMSERALAALSRNPVWGDHSRHDARRGSP